MGDGIVKSSLQYSSAHQIVLAAGIKCVLGKTRSSAAEERMGLNVDKVKKTSNCDIICV